NPEEPRWRWWPAPTNKRRRRKPGPPASTSRDAATRPTRAKGQSRHRLHSLRLSSVAVQTLSAAFVRRCGVDSFTDRRPPHPKAGVAHGTRITDRHWKTLEVRQKSWPRETGPPREHQRRVPAAAHEG